ncbi:MAG: phosphotransferase [Trebonia sp.]
MSDDIPGRFLGAGRNADVYDIGGGRVLRRYRDSRPSAVVAREAEVMRHARAHGVPVPEVFEVSGTDIVMERAIGPTMLDMLARRPWTTSAHARLLARLHTAVRAVPAPASLRAPFGDGTALLHMDLHPQNVILTAGGPVIIDWEGASRGPGTGDVAMTWVVVAFSQINASRIQTMIVRMVQALFSRHFLRAAGPVPRAVLDAAIEYRLGDPNVLPAESARIRRYIAREDR